MFRDLAFASKSRGRGPFSQCAQGENGEGKMVAGDIWTVKAALDWTVGYLERKGDSTPLVSAQWLLSEATGLSRIELYMNHDRPLSMPERDVLREFVTRRGKGEPLQYITGEVGFRHITVKVRPGVLIPRPETEVLVSEVLAALPQPSRPRAAEFVAELALAGIPSGDAKEREGNFASGKVGNAIEGLASDGVFEGGLLVADICTGSGCIACSIAHEHPATQVVATDLSSDAVLLARENVRLLGLSERVEIFEGDLGFCIPAHLMGSFDVVVSNPPYIPTEVMGQLPKEVFAYEPALALDGGADGLDLFHRLIPWVLKALKPGGIFACELHETCLDEAAESARAAGFENVRIVYDLVGKPRILTACKPRS